MNAIKKVDLAFDHAAILSDGVARARSSVERSAQAMAFLKELFRLSELREIAEAVWGQTLDPANFRQKVPGTEDFVRSAGKRVVPSETGGRPAELYRRGKATALRPPMTWSRQEGSWRRADWTRKRRPVITIEA
ncbi:MAG: hypothetical protein WDA27_07835 [Actinomycetota bacterium]